MSAKKAATEPAATEPKRSRVGSIVLYRISEHELRPAVVVRDWGGSSLNLQVLLDGSNDAAACPLLGQSNRTGSVVWCTSVPEGDAIGQWRATAGGEG